MAGLYDLCKITVDTQVYIFRATKGFYTGDIATATGITKATDAADLKLPVMPVSELIRTGTLKTANALANGSGGKKYRVKMHYTEAKATTVEAGIVGKAIPTVAGRANSGAIFASFTNPVRVTSRS